MHLKILLPTEILVDRPVKKVIAEGGDGFFCLLPRHIDFVSALIPGIFLYTDRDNREHYLAVDEGILVKAGDQVTVSSFNAIAGADLDNLRATVDESFRDLDEHERLARTALARLEAGTLRRFMQLEHRPYG